MVPHAIWSPAACPKRTPNHRAAAISAQQSLLGEYPMSKMPPVPPANAPKKGPKSAGHQAGEAADMKDRKHHNSGEEGETANIKQNTTNKGYFHGRRVK